MPRPSSAFIVLGAAMCASLAFAAPLAPVAAPVSPEPAAPPAKAATAGNDYGDDAAWLCRPGRQDACAVDLTTTVVSADGTLAREAWRAHDDPPIDCFYVYPTVSTDPTPNSDMKAGPEEQAVIRAQFARFSSVCRPYAPLYRQVTLAALRAGVAGRPMNADRALGYGDVVDAWNHYLQHDNAGRGVVLVGHSQGSGVLTALLRNEIEARPVRSRIVSALLIGTNFLVPRGKDVGGSLKHLPLCHAPTETGCVVTFASFRSDAPPPPNSRFARGGEEGVAACTNPAALRGGRGELHAYLAAAGRALGSSHEPAPWVQPPEPIVTPFVSVPGLLSAECVAGDDGAHLAVTVHGDPADPRVDDIMGDVVVNGQVQPDWGLHLVDVHLTLGNLLDIVRQQSAAYLAHQRGSRLAV